MDQWYDLSSPVSDIIASNGPQYFALLQWRPQRGG